jgi:hypothetical protein
MEFKKEDPQESRQDNLHEEPQVSEPKRPLSEYDIPSENAFHTNPHLKIRQEEVAAQPIDPHVNEVVAEGDNSDDWQYVDYEACGYAPADVYWSDDEFNEEEHFVNEEELLVKDLENVEESTDADSDTIPPLELEGFVFDDEWC